MEEKEKIFEENMNLVPYVMKNLLHLSTTESDFDDIMQEGYVALWNAIKTFNKGRGSSFSNYACCCIRNKLLAYLNTPSRTFWRDVNTNAIYLDDIVKDDNKMTYNELIPSYSGNDLELYVALKDILNDLDVDNIKTKILIDRMNGYSHKEIAEKYGLNTNVTAVYLSEIRKDIENRLK